MDDHLEQLALLLLAAVLASTLSLGTVMALSQRNGFNDYLRVRKEQELDRFIGVVERHAAQDPSLQWLDRAPEAMHQLVGEHELHRLARWGGVRCEASLPGVRFIEEDSAPGVAPEQLHRLFEPLFRTEGARLRQRLGSAGSGLGLAIAQAIVKAHQGRIAASLSPLGGLRMDIELPRQPA
ncbi:ATP-binding protein [Curvibacter lanceolatus]|uniref:ATP-binding protein n=1 Tax=Curvibacter lanceolatus TaxID=86182 RepID=UPI0023562CF1|nr:ATP-binding protein [Curvibacter lanceolatus]